VINNEYNFLNVFRLAVKTRKLERSFALVQRGAGLHL
jgi:hypothetical protein